MCYSKFIELVLTAKLVLDVVELTFGNGHLGKNADLQTLFVFYLVKIADDSFESYCQRMRMDKTWGDANCLAAASKLYNCSIYIYTLDNSQPMVFDSGGVHGTWIAHLTVGFVPQVIGHKPTHYVSLSAIQTTTPVPGMLMLTIHYLPA